ncbi:HypC/HybG/HupF family hydrogenase formation chaperone [Candidatus Symbiopectobacterium sp. NZEC151]|uniref:HypC/HybG/HupF family hydrogenase formation chaperone n=1 Tax=Candidatus Symbiopectobacterium sp. NZEC151 TaxID=2820470 RepID=UPI00222613B8|nr:HypC/HybG/HupF family hydrogenase formation chaperone [Candidatus Symbiopectobacterium sp. NZEC151]MCW2473955.1 HypC/HybG/HupF family hydrogenase formation chaperone [Candidatus Symbiopectobacterium sp. NZEC151]
MCLGIPGQILAIKDAANLIAVVSVAGVKREVSIACLVGPQHAAQDCIGDWVLVHVGFAMARLDEQQAAEMLIALSELDELD